jgi:hypothetical protein
MMPHQREAVLFALRHGRQGDEELEEILRADLESLEPLIDEWIAIAELEGLRKQGFLIIMQRLERIENHLLEKFGEAP